VLKTGRVLNPRGAYDKGNEYRACDVVMLDGSSFIAVEDRPGPCPGDGWRLLASCGSRGQRGARGERGEKGEPEEKGEIGPRAAEISAWKIERQCYSVRPLYSDGSLGPQLDLRPVLW
jgi:hypothetical protein